MLVFWVQEVPKTQIYTRRFLETLQQVYDTVDFYETIKVLIMDFAILDFGSFYKAYIDLCMNSLRGKELEGPL